MIQKILKVNYDERHDSLHVFFDQVCPCYDEEATPGIFLSRSEKDDRLAKVTVLDYKAKSDEDLMRALPKKSVWNAVKKQRYGHHAS